MKRFFRIASTIVGLSLCLAMTTMQANAADVSSAAISLDLAAGSVELYEIEGVTYCVQNGETQTTTGGVALRQSDSRTATANTLTVLRGYCSITISAINIKASKPIWIKESASLEIKLLGNNVVTASTYAGIIVSDGASLVLDGTGSLTTKSTGYGAGIGGASGNGVTGGEITINGGTVTAEGGFYSAGIGSYYGYGGVITINGGTVTATGGDYAAGIGGGRVSDNGIITINGGNVKATGSSYAAGIGGGGDGGDGGIVTINGGTVTAVGGYRGTGIGGGGCSYDTGGTGGTIVINGGVVTVTGAYQGSSIGNGMRGSGGTLAINGGSVTVNGAFSYLDAVTITDAATVTNTQNEQPEVTEQIFVDNQSLSTAALEGNVPKVSVDVRAHSGISYQWQQSTNNTAWAEWTDLEGEIFATLTHANIVGSGDTYLRCKLTNGWGNVKYTDEIQIYVLAFAKQPTNVDAHLNDMVAFEALSTCSNVTYQWQRSYDDGATWSNVPDETYSTLIISATLAESRAKYRCVITATNGDQLASDVVSVNLDLGELVTYTVQDFMQEVDGSYTMKYQQVLEGLSGITVTAPEAGYDGFALNDGKSTLSGTVAEDNSLVLTRYFDRNIYSITFDTNGGSALPDLEAFYGAPIEAPSAPTCYGQVFDGWYADENLTEEYGFDTMPLNGTTVYAKWTPLGANRGIEYSINGLAIRDSDTFELLDEIPDGNFLAEVSVTNLDAAETDTIMLVYYTDAGQMIGMNYMFANTPIGYTATFGAAVDNTSGSIGIIRAFVLPSLGNPIPLAESKSIGQ